MALNFEMNQRPNLPLKHDLLIPKSISFKNRPLSPYCVTYYFNRPLHFENKIRFATQTFFINVIHCDTVSTFVTFLEMRLLGLILGLCLIKISVQSCREVENNEKYNNQGKRLCASVYEVSQFNCIHVFVLYMSNCAKSRLINKLKKK